MKLIRYIPMLGMSVSLLMATVAALAAGPSYRLAVDGLACPFCAYGIEKKLSALAGVERLETDIEDGSVIVTMQDDAILDEAAAQQAVKAAGFSLRTFEQVAPGALEEQ
jgi:mercuric ion binding protein